MAERSRGDGADDGEPRTVLYCAHAPHALVGPWARRGHAGCNLRQNHRRAGILGALNPQLVLVGVNTAGEARATTPADAGKGDAGF